MAEKIRELLAARADAGVPVQIWWRDDDAIEPTPALERLLDTRRRFGVPLALAVVPGLTGPELAARLRTEPGVTVLQHGWLHQRHSPPDAKKAEFGGDRPLPEMLAELRAGRDAMERLFGDQFLPVLVPPWNRIDREVAARRNEIGLPGLSAFGTVLAGDAHRADTQLDLIAWRTTRSAIAMDEATKILAAAIESGPDSATIGLLTHHLVHDEATWSLLDALLSLLSSDSGVRWPTIPAVFKL